MSDNTYKRDEYERKSKYVRVLMCCIFTNDNKVSGIDWVELHEAIPGFKYLSLSRADGAIDGRLNKLFINVKQQTSKASFQFRNTRINPNPVNQALHEKLITKYDEHFNILAN